MIILTMMLGEGWEGAADRYLNNPSRNSKCLFQVYSVFLPGGLPYKNGGAVTRF